MIGHLWCFWDYICTGLLQSCLVCASLVLSGHHNLQCLLLVALVSGLPLARVSIMLATLCVVRLLDNL